MPSELSVSPTRCRVSQPQYLNVKGSGKPQLVRHRGRIACTTAQPGNLAEVRAAAHQATLVDGRSRRLAPTSPSRERLDAAGSARDIESFVASNGLNGA